MQPKAIAAASPVRVRIHLNLAQPERAECAVKVQSPRGGWITVGYSTHLRLENCQPVVDLQRQQVISRGEGKKTPHAFIEGDLVAFQGRVRPVAPQDLVRASGIMALGPPGAANDVGQPINYNPRFARCFYLDQPSKDLVSERLVSCGAMDVVGWSFLARDIRAAPLQPSDMCPGHALQMASKFEKQAISAGIATTRKMLPAIGR